VTDDGRGLHRAALPARTFGRTLLSRDWWFRDRTTGELVVAQFPNAALWILLGSIVVRAFVTGDALLASIAGWVGTAALAWWALDEVTRGVNPWRRLLGLAGCGLVIVRVLTMVS
jgi:hypothetical protein